MIDVPTTSKEQLVQNSLTSKCPAFATTPYWYISGCEKKVKIGSVSFNYIDYLEAWEHHDCGTYRSREALNGIRAKIQEAFLTVEAKANEVHQKQDYNSTKK